MPSPCNNAMLRRASRMLGQVYDEELAASGLRTTQHSLLAQIDKMKGPTLRELATEIVMDLSALGHTLKPLIRDRYVILVPDKDDRRVKHVTLTRSGKSKLERSRLASSGRGPSSASRQSLEMSGRHSFVTCWRELSSETFRQAFKRS